MKRSSVVGPLLLIAIGLLFLMRNVFPELPLLDYLARYWPYLLIVWGVLRLVEITLWASRGKPLPQYGLSGGEWTLIVFLCFFGFTMHAVRGFATWLPRSGITMGGLDVFGESYDYPLNGEIATSKTPRVVIASFRGNARITGGDVDAVKVTGRSTIRSLDQSSADKANGQAVLEVVGDANAVTIRTNQDRAPNNLLVNAELEITVPRGASIEAHGRRGDFDITGVNGMVEVESDNAGVRLENLGGDVRINLRNSDVVRAVKIKGAFDLKGRGSDLDLEDIEGPVTVDGARVGVSQFRNLKKPIRLTSQFLDFSAQQLTGNMRLSIGDLSASGLVGPVRLNSSRSRDVEFSDVTNSLDINLARGDIQLRAGTQIPKMEVHTRSGDIELALPPNAKIDLTATTQAGDLENDYGAPISEESGRRGGTMRGSNGGPTINMSTDRGDIRIRRASASEGPLVQKGKQLPPLPPLPAEAPEVPRPLNQ